VKKELQLDESWKFHLRLAKFELNSNRLHFQNYFIKEQEG
jgi:hypothetical protein